MESNFNKIMDYANKRNFNQYSNQEIKLPVVLISYTGT